MYIKNKDLAKLYLRLVFQREEDPSRVDASARSKWQHVSIQLHTD